MTKKFLVTRIIWTTICLNKLLTSAVQIVSMNTISENVNCKFHEFAHKNSEYLKNAMNRELPQFLTIATRSYQSWWKFDKVPTKTILQSFLF